MSALLWILVACTSAELGRIDTEVGTQPDIDAYGDHECEPAAAIRINEVCPSNDASLVDSDGDSPDWLELVNAAPAAVDLEGWTLSDDEDEPQKWTLPAVVLDPGELLVVFASNKNQTRVVGSWDTRVASGHTWRFLEVLGPTETDWFLPTYDDASWPLGPSGFGFGDGDDATVVDADTVYVRTTIDLTADELADLVSVFLHVDYDDAFVAYLNGVEVARAGIGTVGTPPAWDELGEVAHEAEMYTGGSPAAFDLTTSLGLLAEGWNTLALEVHQATLPSSDLTLLPFLTLGFGADRGGSLAPELEVPKVELHTNFALKAGGERLRLYDPTGCEADDLDPIELLADESYGRQPDGTGDLGYFLEPTPGAPNTTEWRVGFAPTPTFDPPPGHYVGGTVVAVEADTEVRIAFDGYEPTELDALYAGPVEIAADREARVIRARGYEDGLWPSRIATGTWFTIAPSEYAMVSLVTDPPNLWDEATGIYVFGPEDYDPEPPFFDANFWEDWERPVHMAGWEPDGTMGFAVDAGLEIHGNYTRQVEQKSLLVSLDGTYDADLIAHEVFPGLGVDTFDRLLLRSAGNDWLGCMSVECFTGAHLRDPLMHRIAADADIDVLAARPAEVWLNGEYWGLYWLNEKPDASYVAAHHGYEDIDLLEHKASANEGDADAYLELMDWLRTHDLADPASFAYVEEKIDVEELATYLAFQVYYDNDDWPGNNIKYWRPRTSDGRWRWMMYDTDFGLGMYGAKPENDSLAAALATDGPNWPNPPWSTELFRLLIVAPAFRDLFVNTYADHLNTSLMPTRMQDLLDETAAEIGPAIPRQLERWGTWTDGVDTLVMPDGTWEDAVAEIHAWMALRPPHARSHVVSNLGLAGTWRLTLDADPPGAGTFALTAVDVEPPFEGTYFQGVPVTIAAVPAVGYSFVGWSDPTLPATSTITIDAIEATDLVAWFE